MFRLDGTAGVHLSFILCSIIRENTSSLLPPAPLPGSLLTQVPTALVVAVGITTKGVRETPPSHWLSPWEHTPAQCLAPAFLSLSCQTVSFSLSTGGAGRGGFVAEEDPEATFSGKKGHTLKPASAPSKSSEEGSAPASAFDFLFLNIRKPVHNWCRPRDELGDKCAPTWPSSQSVLLT